MAPALCRAMAVAVAALQARIRQEAQRPARWEALAAAPSSGRAMDWAPAAALEALMFCLRQMAQAQVAALAADSTSRALLRSVDLAWR